ncbi:shikimate kinase [Acetivibrio clariflavus]|uniref:Shikimate kinase n=1 Tax=Acetivibrio clariflavus (strain DSM 19732 / NBRC 101661 / EBR45) TaxID=720554 RepID=G8LU51_ACECE|nr:shikimate kinase [Acetivibrio clariflavus]AEV68439.1 shikimate kinase [Acetivibrio clariflavus DSM 19732]
MKFKNIVLIGMPSSGKSTIGKPLSKELNMQFIDTDSLIFEREKRALKDIVNEDGLERFLQIQENIILEIDAENHVISTGGSVVYNARAMEHLKKDGYVVFLDVKLDEINSRLKSGRRFARNPNQSFEDLYKERLPLYQKYANITIDCSNKSVELLVKEIKDRFLSAAKECSG